MSEDSKDENIESAEQNDFNEKEEIEKLQEKIKKMSNTDEETNASENNQPETNSDLTENQTDLDYAENSLEEDDYEDKNTPKKFIISVEPKSVEYFDNLSVDERSKLINELLYNYIQNEDKINAKKRKKRILMHIIVAAITLIFAIPAAFYVVNKAIHLTVLNYKGAQANFEKLYESRGVILEHQRIHGNQ